MRCVNVSPPLSATTMLELSQGVPPAHSNVKTTASCPLAVVSNCELQDMVVPQPRVPTPSNTHGSACAVFAPKTPVITKSNMIASKILVIALMGAVSFTIAASHFSVSGRYPLGLVVQRQITCVQQG